jgi:hypothetical protein
MLSQMLRRLVIAISIAATAACQSSQPPGRSDSAAQAKSDALAAGDGDSQDSNALAGPDASFEDMARADAGSDGLGTDVAITKDTSAEAGTSVRRDGAGTDAFVPVSDVLATSDGSSPDAARADSPRDAASPDELIRKDAAMEAGQDGSSGGDSLASFCTGDLPRLATNGYPVGPAIRTYVTATDCCDRITIELITATFTNLLYVSWSVPPTEGSLPADIDLGSAPDRWGFHVSTSCQSGGSSCTEVYDSGFLGRLQVSLVDGGPGYDVKLCVHVEESPGAPHATLHSFDLYLPRLTIAN